MKQTQVVKILAAEFNTINVAELNKLLRAKTSPKTKYRLSGDSLGHLGVTGLVKMLTPEGVKIIGTTRTILIRYEDIEGFEKAKLRSERPVYDGPKKPAQKTALQLVLEEDDQDEDDGDDLDLVPLAPKKKRRPQKPAGKAGSKFIPKAKK